MTRPLRAGGGFLIRLEFGQKLARRDLIAGLHQNLANAAVALGDDLVLHFHGFEHHDALSLGDRIVRLGEHIDDDAVHRRE